MKRLLILLFCTCVNWQLFSQCYLMPGTERSIDLSDEKLTTLTNEQKLEFFYSIKQCEQLTGEEFEVLLIDNSSKDFNVFLSEESKHLKKPVIYFGKNLLRYIANKGFHSKGVTDFILLHEYAHYLQETSPDPLIKYQSVAFKEMHADIFAAALLEETGEDRSDVLGFLKAEIYPNFDDQKEIHENRIIANIIGANSEVWTRGTHGTLQDRAFNIYVGRYLGKLNGLSKLSSDRFVQEVFEAAKEVIKIVDPDNAHIMLKNSNFSGQRLDYQEILTSTTRAQVSKSLSKSLELLQKNEKSNPKNGDYSKPHFWFYSFILGRYMTFLGENDRWHESTERYLNWLESEKHKVRGSSMAYLNDLERAVKLVYVTTPKSWFNTQTESETIERIENANDPNNLYSRFFRELFEEDNFENSGLQPMQLDLLNQLRNTDSNIQRVVMLLGVGEVDQRIEKLDYVLESENLDPRFEAMIRTSRSGAFLEKYIQSIRNPKYLELANNDAELAISLFSKYRLRDLNYMEINSLINTHYINQQLGIKLNDSKKVEESGKKLCELGLLPNCKTDLVNYNNRYQITEKNLFYPEKQTLSFYQFKVDSLTQELEKQSLSFQEKKYTQKLLAIYQFQMGKLNKATNSFKNYMSLVSLEGDLEAYLIDSQNFLFYAYWSGNYDLIEEGRKAVQELNPQSDFPHHLFFSLYPYDEQNGLLATIPGSAINKIFINLSLVASDGQVLQKEELMNKLKSKLPKSTSDPQQRFQLLTLLFFVEEFDQGCKLGFCNRKQVLEELMKLVTTSKVLVSEQIEEELERLYKSDKDLQIKVVMH